MSWDRLITHYTTAAIEAPELRAVTLAQWILESGRGESDLAQEHFNFAGLKFRAEMADHCVPVDYEAHDGVDTYCKFDSVEAFVSGYWVFINRSVYDGWRDHADNPAGYIRFLHSRGYAGDPRYPVKVLGLLEEAQDLLGEAGQNDPPDGLIKKLAVVVGHNEQAEGAYASAPLNSTEFDYNNVVARSMRAAALEYNFDVRVINRLRSSSVRREIQTAYRKADDWGADLIVELHFNAAGSARARGTETLVRNERASQSIARNVQEEMVETLGLRDRGVKVRGPNDRGGISLHASNAPTVLVEPFFGSNRDDRIALASIGEEALARCYLRGLRSGASNLGL